MRIRVKLSKTTSFEPNTDSIKSFIVWQLLNVVSYFFHKNFAVFIAILILFTIIFIWLESVYYPYGVKYDDDSPG